MNKSGPIVLIEDDIDDKEILQEIFSKLKYENEIVFFDDAFKAFDYLQASPVTPFLIISDINLPKITGIELREKIRNSGDVKLQCVPILFFTNEASQATLIEAYCKSVQGFFKKPATYYQFEHTIKVIIEYWKECRTPYF
jgi:DNA-binding NtrC family response regulator